MSERLDGFQSSSALAQAMTQDPAFGREVEAQLPALEAAARAPANRDMITKIIQKRFSLYPQPQRSVEEWADWWAAYFDVLEGVPTSSIEAGMRAYVADPESEFLPKPGKLKALAEATPSRSLLRYNRARSALHEVAQAERDAAWQARPKPTQAEIEAEAAAATANREKVHAMALETAAMLGAKAKARKPLPSIAGIPDETGITPQMRALMEARA